MGCELGMPGKPYLNPFRCLVAGAAIGMLVPSFAIGQVRGKLPDRGVYQPPRLATAEATANGEVGNGEAEDRVPLAVASGSAELVEPSQANDIGDLVRSQSPESASGKKPRSLVEVVLDDLRETARHEAIAARGPEVNASHAANPSPTPSLQQVSHQDVMLVPPTPPAEIESEPSPQPLGKLTAFSHDTIASPVLHHDATCDGCDHCDSLACDSVGCGVFGCDSCDASCDTLGCDSMGCGSQSWYRRWRNGSLCFDRDRWFGSVEYLMMWRRGDRLPALLTTDISATPNSDTAGRLGQANTRVLVGQDRIMQRLSSGGRVTIGTWLDDRECVSLVARGWLAGRKNYRYSQNQDQTSILTRPFLNVSDNQTPAQDTQIIAFPNRASGSVHIAADSEAFGADVSLRQFLYGDLGVTVDFVYGYQFMRVNESLAIASSSTSLSEDFAPIGSTLSVVDGFDVSNEFHGGQLGLATSYRERCWSFNGLAKVGFGSLSRQATRSGLTVTTVDDATATDDNGLLVRSTNSGTVTDHTFGWIPELDFSLGWHRFANWDLTFGYHIIAMTDALQPHGAIDPALAVNLSDPPIDEQRPSDDLRYRTFYLQGIHFGLQHVY